MRRQQQVPGGADGQVLRDPLDDPEDDPIGQRQVALARRGAGLGRIDGGDVGSAWRDVRDVWRSVRDVWRSALRRSRTGRGRATHGAEGDEQHSGDEGHQQQATRHGPVGYTKTTSVIALEPCRRLRRNAPPHHP